MFCKKGRNYRQCQGVLPLTPPPKEETGLGDNFISGRRADCDVEKRINYTIVVHPKSSRLMS